jgi:uncharacterized protein YraI
MRLRALLICVLLLCLTAVSSAQGGLLANVTAGAWLRSGPGTEWAKLENLQPGRALLLDGQAYQGTWVRGITTGGRVGWIITTALNINTQQAAGLPTVTVETPFTLPAPPATADQASAPAAGGASAPAVPAAPAGAVVGSDEGLLTNTTTTINMRQSPSTSAAVVTRIRPNTPILIDGRDQSGAWVRGIIPSGQFGWVSNGGVAINQQQIGSLAIISTDRPFVLSAPSANAAPAAAPTAVPAGGGVAPVVSNNAPIANTAPVRGFAYGGHVNSLSDGTVSALNRSGMTWVKKQWRYFAGNDANAVAGTINEAHGKGFRILLGIVGSPSELLTPGYNDQYAAFVGAVAALGADAIEVWNEPNIDREWPAGSIDPVAYTELLRVSYNAIKARNPNTLVISGAPAPTGFFGGCSGGGCDDNIYVSRMAAAGAANYMDCLGAHYNEGILPPNVTSGDPRGNSGHYSRYFWGMVNTYNAAIGGRRPICFTELGYLSPEGYGGLPPGFEWAANVTVAQQAAWLDSAVNLARNSGKVRLLIVWNVDFTNYGSDPMAGFAMIRADGSCPACDALGR